MANAKAPNKKYGQCKGTKELFNQERKLMKKDMETVIKSINIG